MQKSILTLNIVNSLLSLKHLQKIHNELFKTVKVNHSCKKKKRTEKILKKKMYLVYYACLSLRPCCVCLFKYFCPYFK